MRDLLVRATAVDDWDAGVLCAARLAAAHHGSLTAIHVVPGAMTMAPASAWDGGEMVAAFAAEIARELQDSQAKASAFSAWASSLGVAHPLWTGANAGRTA